MSRVYEALQQIKKDLGQPETSPFPPPTELLGNTASPENRIQGVKSVKITIQARSLLVALTEPKSLGGEKFRALATRLENLRRKKEMKSLQVTSSAMNEGKTFVAANLAITFANHTRSRVLLIEGDMRKPSLAGLLGLNDLKGLAHWWSEGSPDIDRFLCQLNDMPLWFLAAGSVHEQPSHILQSPRLAEAFNRLTACFDWIVVDSTPMLSVTDVNLWSRLVDGTLLVVREGVASVKVLQKGLDSLDNLKLIGTVLNDASGSDQANYYQYYGASKK